MSTHDVDVGKLQLLIAPRTFSTDAAAKNHRYRSVGPTSVLVMCSSLCVAGVGFDQRIQLQNTLLLQRSLVDLQTNQSED